MTDYTSPEFLSTPQGSDSYEDLDWHNKIKIKALEGLDQLAANLNAIANVKAIEFQINHLNSLSDGFNEQMAAKDEQIATLTTQLNNIGNVQAAQQALLEAEIASLKAANESLSDNFNKFKAVLTSIDQMADEAIG
jgi:chromosome segregation ATPase